MIRQTKNAIASRSAGDPPQTKNYQPQKTDMKNQHNVLKAWTKPELKTLSISRDTNQDGGPKPPPDYEPKAS